MSDPAGSLAGEHEALMQFLYLAPVGLVQADPDGEIAMINPVSAQLLMPLSRDGGLGNLFTALQDVAPELRTLAAQFTAPSGVICDGRHVHLHGGGGTGPQILALSLVKLDGSRLMAVLSDITLQVQRERQLRTSDTWLNTLLAGSSDYALASLDEQGRIERWHDSIGRVTGHTQGVVGQPFTLLLPADAAGHGEARLREADSTGWSSAEGPCRRADGSTFPGSSIVAPLPPGEDSGDGAGAYCLVLRDLSACRESATAAHVALLTDPLTGVGNRRAFFEAARLELGRQGQASHPAAIVLLVADHCAEVAQRYGAAAGDAVLCALAQALRTAFRHVDVVARIQGDRFAVLLPDTDAATAGQVAERLRATVQQEAVEVDGRTMRYTVSAGVTALDGRAGGIEQVVARAEAALEYAIAQGRNRVVMGGNSGENPERVAGGDADGR
ncbi:sensor domain-containing diguanylate cyclase [Pseudoduganella chitinolytica]|uniref:Sensor domain-containing diguanylate cyclase n=1 Tax=Pseudoduganella chitinolytica TaxID=34070 RepID=A0ABY8B4L0_9BURK|nr:sensor domain-containing diguanylate cyclase [Pseudoduganella chitinolytica]WEF30686.1 sensor domain-containing diguanylate cyclase [Pseudoduganella chitinolytica]